MTAWKPWVCLLAGLLLGACAAEVSEQAYIESAQAYLDEGQWGEASIELKNALRLNPDNAQARWLLGKLHLRQGDLAAAEKELKRARELGVVDESVLPLLARALAGQGRDRELLGLQTQGLSDPAAAQVLSAQASVLLGQGKLEEAGTTIARALALAPDSAPALTEQARLALAKGEPEQARGILEGLLKTHDRHAPAWSLLGDLERQGGQGRKAVQAYGKAIEYRPDNTGDLLKRALTRIELKEYPQAQPDIDLLVKRVPGHFEVNYAQGLVHFHGQRYGQARVSFEQSVKTNSSFLPALFYLGASHHLLGEREQADASLSRFVAANPGSVKGRQLLAQIRLQGGDFVAAERLVRPVVAHDPDDLASLKLLSAALVGQGKIEEGVVLLEKAVELEPESAPARVRLGAALLSKGDDAGGVAQLQAALERDAGFEQAHLTLARYYLRRKEFEQALATAEAYRAHYPGRAAAYNLLGAVRLARQETQAAGQAFAKARELAPGHVAANHNLAALAMRDKDYAGARRYYEEVLTHHPDNLDSLMKLAMLDERENREEAMVKHLEQAIAAEPRAVQPRTSLARYHLGKGAPEQVAVVLGELQQRQANNPLVLDVLGRAQLAQGDGRSARATLERLVELQPDSAETHFLLGQAHARLGASEQLQAELEKAVALSPDHLPARVALARLLLLRGDGEGARQQLALLKESSPDNPDVLSLEAAVASMSGQQEQALDIYARVFDKVSSTTNMLTLARQKWAVGDRDGALALQEQWVEAHPKDLTARLALAGAYSAAERTREAVAQYEAVLERTENNALALNNLAWLLMESDPARALKYAQKVHALAPESAAVTDTLAMVLMKNGEFERALRMSQRALNNAPGNPSFLYHKAMILEAAGLSGEAESVLVQVLGAPTPFPERRQAEQQLARLKYK